MDGCLDGWMDGCEDPIERETDRHSPLGREDAVDRQTDSPLGCEDPVDRLTDRQTDSPLGREDAIDDGVPPVGVFTLKTKLSSGMAQTSLAFRKEVHLFCRVRWLPRSPCGHHGRATDE